ncbi:MAG: hypothetical protein ABSF67_18225 [Roseiarcus sp.]|jgi:hypothetical protein
MERQRAPAAVSMSARMWVLTPRFAAGAMFFAFGVGLGAWSGASAAIVARIGLNRSTYGAALTLFTAAYLLAMSSAGAISRRFTAKRALVVSALASAPALAALLLVGDVVSYFVLQTAYGFLAGMVDLTMNAAGARVERGLGRPVLAGMHGAASAGVAISAAAAGLIATSAAPWISCAVVIVVQWAAAAAVELAVAADRGEPVGPVAVDRRAFDSRSLAALGLVIGACITCESAAMAWSGLVLRREAPELAAFAGFGASFFAGCQALQRFNVDRLRARVADRRLIVASLAVASLGFFPRRVRARLRAERRRLRRHRLRHGRGRAVRLRARRNPARLVSGGRAVGGGLLRLIRAPAGAARRRRGRGGAVAFGGVCIVCAAADGGVGGDASIRRAKSVRLAARSGEFASSVCEARSAMRSAASDTPSPPNCR